MTAGFKFYLLGALGIFYLSVLLQPATAIKKCRPLDCEGSSCVTVLCDNGLCDRNGKCVCNGCYSGDSCDKFENVYAPEFLSQDAEAIIFIDDVQESKEVYRVTAIDMDDESTCNGAKPCACSEISYSIQTGNENSEFTIDGGTGSIRISKGRTLAPGTYKLVISAKNPVQRSQAGNNQRNATTVLYVGINQSQKPKADAAKPMIYEEPEFRAAHVDPQDAWEENKVAQLSDLEDELYDEGEHSRHRRSVSASSLSNITFSLLKKSPHENRTSMAVGQSVAFQLQVCFPTGSTTDILVELFTPDNETTIMKLCNPTIVHVGSNLDIDKTKITPKLESRDNISLQYDRGILDFGNVSNSGADTSNDNSNCVHIDFTAVMVQNNETSNGSLQWVSAGAEYNNETEVWVGQASFITIVDGWNSTETPTFNFTGPSTVEIGSSALFTVDMFIPYPSVALNVDAFSPLNVSDVMSVCSVSVKGTGLNYACLPKEKLFSTTYKSLSGLTNSRGRLQLGTVTNAGTREDNNTVENNRISIGIVLKVPANFTLVGNQYWIGAAVELGTDQIWAGQIAISVINGTGSTKNMTTNPTFELKNLGSSNVSVGSSVGMTVEMCIPENTNSNYEMEILAPYNESARFTICKVWLDSHGANIPCGPELKPEFSARDNSTNYDRAVVKFGTIRNIGAYDGKANKSVNCIKFGFAMVAKNHTLNTLGAKAWLTAGMKFDIDRLWVGQRAVYLAEENVNGTDMTNETSPSFKLEYKYGSDHIHVGGSTDVRLHVITKPGVTYKTEELEMLLPFNDSAPVLTLCKVEIIYIGKNLPCANATEMMKTITYSSKGNDTKMDKARMYLGTLINVASTSTNSTEDSIILSMRVKLEDHPLLSNGTKTWVSAGIIYSVTNMWVGQIALTALEDTVPDLPTGMVPHVVTEGEGNSTGDYGECARVVFLLKLPVASTSKYSLTIEANNTMTLCSARILKAGEGFACLNTSAHEANYTEHVGMDFRGKADFDLGVISNTGQQRFIRNGNFDNNTIAVEAIVSIVRDTSIPAGSSHWVAAVLTYGSASAQVRAEGSVTVAPGSGQNTTNTSVPTFEFSVAPGYDNSTSDEAVKGQAVTFYLDIFPAENSTNQLVATFLTPPNDTQAGVMEICDVNLVEVGDNVPCLAALRKTFNSTYDSRTDSNYTDIAVIDLGYACQFPIKNETEANRVRLEVIAKLVKNSSASVGDIVYLSSSVKINNDNIYVTQVGVKITDNFNDSVSGHSNGSLSINGSTETVCLKMGAVHTVQLVVTVPSNASVKGLMDIDLSVNDTAAMGVKAMRLIKVGANLACMDKDLARYLNDSTLLEPVFNSSDESCHKEKAYLDFGVITNTGVTHRKGKFQEEDDQFMVEVDVVMIDGKLADNGTDIWMDFAAKMGPYIYILRKKVLVCREISDTPALNLTLETQSNQTMYSQTESVLVDGYLSHLNTSSAEAHNVTVTLYTPPYIMFVGVNYTNMTIHETRNNSFGVELVFGSFHFCDIAHFVVELKTRPGVRVPGGSTACNATTPYEVTYNMLYRENHQNASGTVFSSKVSNLAYAVKDLPPSACSSALGMQDGRIKDCQISGSPGHKVHVPKNARKGGSDGWSPQIRGGGHYSNDRYLQVYFGNITKITKVGLEHAGVTNVRVGKFKLRFSDDGLTWTDGETVTVADAYTSNDYDLLSPKAGRYVRFVVVENQNHATEKNNRLVVRLEFYGCSMSGDALDADVCEPKGFPPTPGPVMNMSPRTMLYNGADFFMCDRNPNEEFKQQCFTTANGLAWTPIDNFVVSVTGADTQGNIYGISPPCSHVMSDDKGETWISIPYKQYTTAMATTGFVNATSVPVEKTAAEITAGSYSQGPWTATSDGLNLNSAPVLDWTECCWP